MNTITGVITSNAQDIKAQLESKGSAGNKIDCMNEELKEFRKYQVKTGLGMAGGVATTAAATAVVARSSKAQEAIKNFGKKIMQNESVQNTLETLKPLASKAIKAVKNLPGPAKAVLAAGTALTGLSLSTHARQTVYKMGQIDQKYTDKAKVQNILG